MIRKIAFVAHPPRDLERSKRFFGEVLGLRHAADYRGRWSEFTTPDGKTIALDTFSPEVSSSPVPYLALETDDIEAEVRRLEGRGVPIVRGVWVNTDDDDREVCKMAIILDPEGNAIMLHQIAARRRGEEAESGA
jgi:predicted enzyme related to lactoylglutathione lyase